MALHTKARAHDFQLAAAFTSSCGQSIGIGRRQTRRHATQLVGHNVRRLICRGMVATKFTATTPWCVSLCCATGPVDLCRFLPPEPRDARLCSTIARAHTQTRVRIGHTDARVNRPSPPCNERGLGLPAPLRHHTVHAISHCTRHLPRTHTWSVTQTHTRAHAHSSELAHQLFGRQARSHRSCRLN